MLDATHAPMAAPVSRRSPGRQDSLSDIVADFAPHPSQIVFRLQVQPEPGLNAKILFQPQGGISREAPLAVDDLADSIGRNRKIPRKLVDADRQRKESCHPSCRMLPFPAAL